jgi:ubiquitin-activating enzyme E1
MSRQNSMTMSEGSSSFSGEEATAKFLDLHSRQIGTYGLETMMKLVSLRVLIVGCGGLGAEVAKNVALGGVHTISLFDEAPCTVQDQGTNFAVTDEAVRAHPPTTRAEATRQLIKELNPTTRVRVLHELTDRAVSDHSVVIFTTAAPNISAKELCRWNKFCREHQPHAISFIAALQCGVLGSTFVDHGDSFTVTDRDGRNALQKSILEVDDRTDKKGRGYSRIRFETPEGQTAGAFRSFTRLKITGVRGLVGADGLSINDKVFDAVLCPSDPTNTVRIYPSLGSQGYSRYETGGFLLEEKERLQLSFRSLSDSLIAPGAFTDVSPFMDGMMESRNHLVLSALLRYADNNGGRLPPLHNAEAAKLVVAYAHEVNAGNRQLRAATPPPQPVASKEDPLEEWPISPPALPPPMPLVLDSVDEAAVQTMSLVAAAELQPLAAFFGGVVAQEVVKLTGKYMPISQWFHYDCSQLLPSSGNFEPSCEYAPCGGRYDFLTAILGKAFVSRLHTLKLFMVGCGALGCENIKNFALCGICCSKEGLLTVTDNDRIEISNLSRQFLFREDNVGHLKSAAAVDRARHMNAAVNFVARSDFVGNSTEHLFPDRFWMALDGVVNALDNIAARLYVDKQCVLFHKVLVEAGTMGTGGNVDIIVPKKTTSYADGGQADESGGIPMCTLRNFPYIFEHCIEWARAQFDDHFVSPIQLTQQLLEDPAEFVSKIRAEVANAETTGTRRSLVEKNIKNLKMLLSSLKVLSTTPSMEDCVEMAWRDLHTSFRNHIVDLTLAFPADAKKRNGEAFWSGHRKIPTPIDGTKLAEIPDVAAFLISAANLYACMFGLHPEKHAPRLNDPANRWMSQYRTLEWLKSVVSKLAVPPYVRSAVDGLDDELQSEQAGGDGALFVDDSARAAELEALCAVASTSVVQNDKAVALDFEKDDDDNFHIDFVTAASNLRAINYSIPPRDRMHVKMVAGKIIPAIATTTASVTGLALIEFFKVLLERDVSDLRNGNFDIGVNNYVMFERDPPLRNRTNVLKTYIPEKDYTWKKRVLCVPDGFTKYDQLVFDVSQRTTVLEFGDMLLKRLHDIVGDTKTFEIDALGIGKGTLWNGLPKHANTNKSLLEVIALQKLADAGGKLVHPYLENRAIIAGLALTLSVEEEEGVPESDEVDVLVPEIVLRLVD